MIAISSDLISTNKDGQKEPTASQNVSGNLISLSAEQDHKNSVHEQTCRRALPVPEGLKVLQNILDELEVV